jgi:phenylpropionate dioxygenase-like ring-hydroxylating dioxygenase large terminal subunit
MTAGPPATTIVPTAPRSHMPVATESVRVLVDQISDSVGPIGTARSMPPEVYTSPEFFDFEREAVFRRSWVYLCHRSEIPNPGDFLAATIVDDPVVVTHGMDGKIRVLSAVCQHRGYVITESCGNARNLRCPYHSWTYGLDGQLLSAPSMGQAFRDEVRASIRLPEIRTEVWHGLVFANLDPESPPLAPDVAGFESQAVAYRIEDLVVAETVTLAGLPFNWKNMQENALEEYHTTYVHRGYHENAPATMVTHGPFEPGDGAIYRHAGLIIKGGEDVPGRPTFPVIPGLPEENRGFFIFATLPPAMFAAIRPDGIKLFRILPQSAGEMTLTINFLFPPSTVEREDFPKLMDRQRELIALLDQPDIESNTRTHRGLRSMHAPRGLYSPQEASLPQFNAWLLECCRSYLLDGS